jgi:hypothetical protein
MWCSILLRLNFLRSAALDFSKAPADSLIKMERSRGKM